MNRVAIIGLGLIGGSLGLALREAGWPVVGFSRRPETVAEALKRGAIEQGASSLAEVAAGAEIAILATPILALPAVMREISPHLPPTAVVTDVASTKTQVIEWSRQYLPTTPFIGGHPMAGREKQGIEAAQRDLFQGAVYCLVAPPTSPPWARERVEALARAVGAQPLWIEAAEHDYLVAGISHLPLLVSVALMRAVAGDGPSREGLGRLAASGFRDTTRLASGSPEMGRDICLTNRQAILAWLERFSAEVEKLRRMVAGGEAGLGEALEQTRQLRATLAEAKGW